MSEQRFRSLTLHGGKQMAQDGPEPHNGEQSGQVLRFRRGPRMGRRPAPETKAQPGIGKDTNDALARYEEERDDEPINYRQRMLMNVIAVAIVTLLVAVGVWLADTIADLQRDQDCVLQGRGNCAPIEAPRPQ